MSEIVIKSGAKDRIMLFLCYILYSFVSVFAKLAATRESLLSTLFFLGCEVLLLGIYALVWQQALKHFPLIVASSCKGITVVFSLIWSFLFFNETITFWNLTGAGMIILGIWTVSSDE